MAACPGILTVAAMRDGGLARIRVPGGRLRADQALTVAKLAQKLGNGKVDLTNKANLQIRGLRDGVSSALQSELRKAGLLPRAGFADRLRNIAGAPLGGQVPDALVDSQIVVEALDNALQHATDLAALSPKFSFLIDNGAASGIRHMPYDAALIPEAPNTGPTRMRLWLAGQPTLLCAAPQNAHHLLLAAARAALKLSVGTDSRWRVLSSRFSLLEMEKCIALGLPAGLTKPVPSSRITPPSRPKMGLCPQKDNRSVALGLGVPLSRLSAGALSWLAQIASTEGDGTLALAPWQVVFLSGLTPDKAGQMADQAEALGFDADPLFLHTPVYACAGAEGCERTHLKVKSIGRALYEQSKIRRSAKPLKKTVHVSGCARGCAFSGPADALILGRGAADGFEIFAHAPAKNAASAQTLASVPSNHITARELKKYFS